MIIAYLRVSTEKQNLSNQRSEIERFAVQKNILLLHGALLMLIPAHMEVF